MSLRVTGLLLATASLPAQRIVEAAEPNASTATATLLPCGAEAIGSLGSATDEDWFRVVLPAAMDFWAATGPTLTNEVGDTVLTLRDAAGGPLLGSDDGVSRGLHAALFAPTLAAGTYFVCVSAGAAAVPGGGYLLDVRCRVPAAAATPTIAPEAGENNDPTTGGTAANALLPARCSGSLSATGPGGDWDFWRLLVFGDGVLRLSFAPTATLAAAAEDPVVYVFDGATPPNYLAGPFYASDRNQWDQVHELPVAGGLLHVAVRGVAGSAPGDYLLDATVTSAASVTVHAGGCGGRMLSLPQTSVGAGQALLLERPQLGSTWSLEGSNLGANGYAFHVVGLLPTSVDLTPYGAVGCTLEVDFVDTVFQFADAAGRATWSLPVPDTGALLGQQLHNQAAVLDLSNPLGITISNRVSAVIGG